VARHEVTSGFALVRTRGCKDAVGCPHFTVSVALRDRELPMPGALYQFSEVVPAKVIVEFGIELLRDLDVAVATAVLVEVLKRFLKPKNAPKAVFDFGLKDEERTIRARLETADEETLRHAVDRLSDLAARKEDGFEYDEQKQEWRGYL